MKMIERIKFFIRHYNDFYMVEETIRKDVNRSLREEREGYSKLENLLKTSPYDFDSKINKYKEISIIEELLKNSNDYQLIKEGVQAEDLIEWKSKNLLMILNHYIRYANPMYDITNIDLTKAAEIVIKFDSLILAPALLKILESACLKMTDFNATVASEMDYATNRLVFNVHLNSGKRGMYKAIRMFLQCFNSAILDDMRFMDSDKELAETVKEYCSIFTIDKEFISLKDFGHKEDILEILDNTISFISGIKNIINLEEM